MRFDRLNILSRSVPLIEVFSVTLKYAVHISCFAIHRICLSVIEVHPECTYLYFCKSILNWPRQTQKCTTKKLSDKFSVTEILILYFRRIKCAAACLRISSSESIHLTGRLNDNKQNGAAIRRVLSTVKCPTQRRVPLLEVFPYMPKWTKKSSFSLSLCGWQNSYSTRFVFWLLILFQKFMFNKSRIQTDCAQFCTITIKKKKIHF